MSAKPGVTGLPGGSKCSAGTGSRGWVGVYRFGAHETGIPRNTCHASPVVVEVLRGFRCR